MRAALINPSSPFLIDQGVHGPLGLWYLGASLQQAGHEVVYADLGLGDELPDADVWCLTGTTPQREGMASIAAAAMLPLIIGGPHASADPDDALSMKSGPTVIVGEGEEILPALLVAGPVGINFTATRANRIHDLDALPFPDRSQQRRYQYRIVNRDGRYHDAATAITSRGCPHQCAFCSAGVWQRRYTARSAANVLAEMEELKALGYDAVHFYDDSLALDRKRLLAICEGMKGMIWRCFVRADQMDAKLLKAMAKAGCVEIGMGIESGSPRILEGIHKGEAVWEQGQAIRWAHEAGIRVKGFIIVGLPGETWESIDETVAFLDQNPPDDVDVTLLQVYPGSPIYEKPLDYDLSFDFEAAGGWYKGKPGEYRAKHRTSALSANDLTIARDYLEARFKRW